MLSSICKQAAAGAWAAWQLMHASLVPIHWEIEVSGLVVVGKLKAPGRQGVKGQGCLWDQRDSQGQLGAMLISKLLCQHAGHVAAR